MIKTPETNPDHRVVGRLFKGFGVIWFCDSYDTAMGYWLTPVFGDLHSWYNRAPERCNVSERAINATFWSVRRFEWNDDVFFGCQHGIEPHEKVFLLTQPANLFPQ